ncbi:MAG TPA: amidohydrolase family protein [Oscillatoriaceae cyanobacterium]
MRIDLHVHLAGVGPRPRPGELPCGCFVSQRMTLSPVYGVLRALHTGLNVGEQAANEAFVRRLVGMVEGAQQLDYACLFAMDGVYDAAGDLVVSESHLYVPNAYVFDVARRSPRLLPVISVNPMRKDALAELERWGPNAVALKWLGPLQKFDASESRFEPFYDALKELGLPVIAHSGCEHTFPGMEQRLGDPLLYEKLVQRGVPVIFSHCGTGSFMAPGHDYSENFVRLLERYDNVYGDTSAFCSLVRWKQLRRFGADRYVGRIFHGSDWPIPSNALYFLGDLGFNRVFKLEAERNPLDRDAATKRAMGMPDSVFNGAYELLAPRIATWETYRTHLNLAHS